MTTTITPTVCKACDSPTVEVVAQRSNVKFRGTDLVIDDDTFSRCTACGEDFYTGAQAKELDRKVLRAYRDSQRLLNGAEIKALRTALFLSQAQFEESLGLGPKTVVRWENDAQVQSRAIDNVLRLIQLDPDNLRLLVWLRSAALLPHIDQNVPCDLEKSAGIKTAIYAGLESVDIDSAQVQQVAEAVYAALIQYKHARLMGMVNDQRVAI
jgi:HTH-type transcriptional regulator / antitoxin MqsA